MKRPTASIILGALPFCTAAPTDASPAMPSGPGQIQSPIEFVADLSPPASDPQRHFALQKSPTSKLVLTASNGFFDSGIVATGTSELKDAAGRAFIDPDFEVLEKWSKPGLSARWHVWIESPGTLHANVDLTAPESAQGSIFELTLADQTRTLTIGKDDKSEAPQAVNPGFTINKSGWHTLTITLAKLSGPKAGTLRRINLWGPAAKGSGLLRARWRPAACHARFSSSEVAQPKLWVMSTRPSSTAGTTSYSPVTTPFGYYGCSFQNDGTATGGANFSLWSYGRGKPTPQERWSHMLASGSPLATFGSFGHEGSGVKLRGDWKPFAGAPIVTLALRCEVARPWTRWFGYYLDPATQRFRFYAAASKWLGDTKRPPSLNPGAFVEQPGPPQRRRGGDLTRDVHRRGWMLDSKDQWHPIDTMTSGKASVIASKHWRTTEDQWFSMGMGGMPHRPGPGDPVRLGPASLATPKWLNEQAVADLHRLPATIGPREVTDISRTSASIRIPITLSDPKQLVATRVTVYYGPEDCLTFDRDLGFRETKTRHWPHQTKPVAPAGPVTTVALRDLKPGTQQFFRVLVETPEGSIWSFETDAFTTTP